MKRSLIISIIISLICITSCTVLSFYPLYTVDKLIIDDRITGKWLSLDNNNDSLVWEISFDGKNKSSESKSTGEPIPEFLDKTIENMKIKKKANNYRYSLKLYEFGYPESEVKFNLHIVKLEDKTYLNFFPENFDVNNDIMSFHLMPVNTFAKVEIGEQVEIHWFSSEWLEEKFKKNKIRIKHEKNENYTLLTAKPKELQKFFIKYSDDEGAYSKDMHYNLTRL